MKRSRVLKLLLVCLMAVELRFIWWELVTGHKSAVELAAVRGSLRDWPGKSR